MEKANKQYKVPMWVYGVLCVSTPISYIIHPVIFLLLILAQMALYIINMKLTGEGFLLLLLVATTFSGVSLLGLKIYDWIILLFFVLLLIYKKMNFVIPIKTILFICSAFLVFVVHGMQQSELIETVRYVNSIVVILILLNLKPNLNRLSPYMIYLCGMNLYNSIIVYFLIETGNFENYQSSIFSSTAYIFTDELRLNGFFTDPNKYMTFSLAVLFIIEVFMKEFKWKHISICLLCVSTIISMSRTGIVCVTLYIFLKCAMYIKAKSPQLFLLSVGSFLLLVLVILAFPNMMNSIINNIYVFLAEILGREHTLEINATLQEDNRVIVWQEAIRCFKQSPLIGHGWLSYQQLLPYPVHNTILSILLDGGLYFFIPYIYVFWPLFFHKRYDVSIPCIVIPLLLLDLGNYRMWFILLALVFLEKAKEKTNEYQYLSNCDYKKMG